MIDDSHLVDLSKSTVRALDRSMIGYPGSTNRIVAVLKDSNGERVSLRSHVRIGCKGARPVYRASTLSRGVYRFLVEPLPDASNALCAVTVGKRILSTAARFEILEPCARSTPDTETEQARQWAIEYAPVIYQDVGRWPRADFLSSLFFDGNSILSDNRDNLNAFSLIGTVYYSFVETATHIFLIYSFYHPVGYGLFADESSETIENEMSGMLVVVDKAHPRQPPVLVETYMAGQFLHYVSSREITPGTERIEGDLYFEDRLHPRVFLEAGRHGCLISSDWIMGEYIGLPGTDFQGGTGIVYRYSENAKEPEGPNDRFASYRLVPILESIWKFRDQVSPASFFSSKFKMDTGCEYPYQFYASKALKRSGQPPWAWDDVDDEGIKAGEWFFWPAKVISEHFKMPAPFDLDYLYNPYLGVY